MTVQDIQRMGETVCRGNEGVKNHWTMILYFNLVLNHNRNVSSRMKTELSSQREQFKQRNITVLSFLL